MFSYFMSGSKPSGYNIVFVIHAGLTILAITIESTFLTFSSLYKPDMKSLTQILIKRFLKKDLMLKSKDIIFLMAISFTSIMIIFSATYYLIGDSAKNFNEQSVDISQAVYLSFTAMTVGPAGMEPHSLVTRILVIYQVAVGLVYSITVFSFIVSLLQNSNKNP